MLLLLLLSLFSFLTFDTLHEFDTEATTTVKVAGEVLRRDVGQRLVVDGIGGRWKGVICECVFLFYFFFYFPSDY